MTTPTPHSADALKHDDCQAEFEAWFAKWTDDDTHFYLIKRQAAIAAWQAAWNRRPTPASPGLDNEAAARLRKQAEEAKKVRGVVALSPEDAFALLDCLERAEAELASVPQFSRAALMEFNAKYCLNKPDLVACAESAFYWFGKCYGLKGAAAGAVPEGSITGDEVTALAHKLISDLKAEFDGLDEEALNYCARGVGSLNSDILTFIKNRAAAPKASPLDQYMQASIELDAATDNFYGQAAPSQQAEAAPETSSTYIHRCERCNGLGHVETDTPAAAPSEPVAWIRFRSDGGYEGPIMDCAMEEVRKKSGAWTPLVIATPPAQDAGTGAVIEAARKLVKARGRYHTEMNYKALAEAVSAIANSGRTE